MICFNCGNQIAEDDAFCPYCGAKQPSFNAPGEPVSQPDEREDWMPPPPFSQPDSWDVPARLNPETLAATAELPAYDDESGSDELGDVTDFTGLENMDYLDDPEEREEPPAPPKPKRERKKKKSSAEYTAPIPEIPVEKKRHPVLNAVILVVVFGIIVAMAFYIATTTLDTLDEYRLEREQHSSDDHHAQPELQSEIRAYITGVDNRGLALRTEIGENGGEILTMLPAGAEVVVLDENESAFSYVYYELTNLYGYAKKWNLTVSPDAVCGYAIYFAGEDGAELYETADAEESYDSLLAGKEVQLIARYSNSRWLVLTQDEYAYVDPASLVEDSIAEEILIGSGPAPKESDYEVYYVDGVTYYLALRTDGIYNQDNEIGAMHNEEKVYVIRKEGNIDTETDFWYVYSPVLEMYGYCNSNYLLQ